MGIIKARLAHAPSEELESKYFQFKVLGYFRPLDLVTPDDCGTPPPENWHYLNSNGYAQKYDPNKPPSRYPAPERLILVPVFPEEF